MRKAGLPRRAVAVCGIALVIAAAVVAYFGAVQPGAASGKAASSAAASNRIYMVGSVTNNTFWAAVKKGFEDGAQTFGFTGVYNAPGVHSASQTIPLIEAAIGAHPAGIAINYQDKSLQKPVLDALKAKLAVVLYNNRLFQAVPGQANSATTDPRITNLSYVGEDTLMNAESLASTWIKSLKPKSKVVIFDPVPGVLTLVIRRQGLEKILHATGHATTYLPGALDEGTNLATIGAYLQAHPDTGGVAGLGDPTGNPAAQYVKKNHLKVAVCAFDVDAESLQLIKSGYMQAATDQQPYLQGYLSAMNLSLIVKKKLFPVTINTGSYIVTKANVDAVAKAVSLGNG